jgi:hypothetical protein
MCVREHHLQAHMSEHLVPILIQCMGGAVHTTTQNDAAVLSYAYTMLFTQLHRRLFGPGMCHLLLLCILNCFLFQARHNFIYTMIRMQS